MILNMLNLPKMKLLHILRGNYALFCAELPKSCSPFDKSHVQCHCSGNTRTRLSHVSFALLAFMGIP